MPAVAILRAEPLRRRYGYGALTKGAVEGGALISRDGRETSTTDPVVCAFFEGIACFEGEKSYEVAKKGEAHKMYFAH
jgi:hypothetical protein